MYSFSLAAISSGVPKNMMCFSARSAIRVAMRNADTVVGGSGAQQQHFDSEKRFRPHRYRCGGFVLANLIALFGHIPSRS